MPPSPLLQTLRFPPAARVRSGSDFARVFADGKRAAHALLALHWLAQPDGTPRLGLAVSRKVSRHAHQRNRIKRILRDVFRHQRSRLLPADYVIVVRPAAAQASPDALRQALLATWRRSGALPDAAAAGTMAGLPSPLADGRVSGAAIDPAR